MDERNRHVRAAHALRSARGRRVGVVQQRREAFLVRDVPLGKLALRLLRRRPKLRQRSHRNGFGNGRARDVVRALRVLREARDAVPPRLAVDDRPLAVDHDEGEVLARKLGGAFEDRLTRGDAHIDVVRLDLARLDDRDAGLRQRLSLAGLQVLKADGAPVREQRKRLGNRLLVPILTDADAFLVHPVDFVGEFLRLELDHLGVRVTAFVFGLRDALRQNPVARITLDRVRRRRVGKQAKRVAQRFNTDVLLERRVVAPIDHDAPGTHAAKDLLLAGIVDDRIPIGYMPDVTGKALQRLSGRLVAVFHGAHLALRAIGAHVVHDALAGNTNLVELVAGTRAALLLLPNLPLLARDQRKAHVFLGSVAVLAVAIHHQRVAFADALQQILFVALFVFSHACGTPCNIRRR